MPIKYIDGKRFYRSLAAGGRAVISNQDYLDKINVFPVADGDTGINLTMTIQAILDQSKIAISLKETLNSVADSAINGARGNSGIIFAQYLYGLSYELPDNRSLTLKPFATAAQKAVARLYESLTKPIEGTMLTVIREWADSLVLQSNRTSDYREALAVSLMAARQSLKDTPSKLKVLADVGVVDAGASGFVSFLEGALDYINKGSLSETSEIIGRSEYIPQENAHAIAPDKFRYCTEAILTGFTIPVDRVKEIVGIYGESLIVAGGKEKLHIHLHTDEPDQLFDALFGLGKVSGAKVDDMLRQYQVSHERKYPIGIVTDTACDLPSEFLDRYQIAQIPFGINFGNRFYLDKDTIKPDEFYQLMLSSKVHPVSSQPSPTTIKNMLEFAAMNFDKVIVINISDHLSGVFQTLLSLSKEFADKISVINSKHLSVSEGLVTLRIAQAIEAGMSFEDILSKSETWIANTKIYTDINTLKYMVKGGRVKPLTGFIATMLNLKPIVSLDANGKAIAYGKSFSRKNNMRKITGIIREELKYNKLWEYAIVHADAEERALKYAAELTSLTGKKPAYIMPLSPVVGVHNGIGSVGIGVAYDS